MTCEGSGQTETCNQRDGHVGWLICPVHGAEIRAMARSISAQQPQPGGSGAGSTDRMILTAQAIIIRDLRADLAAARNDSLGLETRIATLQGMLEAAQAEIERLRESQSRIIDGWYDWDRQLRDALATIERQNAVITAARKASTARGQRNWHVANCGGGECDEHYATQSAQLDAELDLDTAIAALDRATKEATTSQHASNQHGEAPSRVAAPNYDHRDTENADGPAKGVS